MYALVENYNHQIHRHTNTHRDRHTQMGAVLKPNERELV